MHANCNGSAHCSGKSNKKKKTKTETKIAHLRRLWHCYYGDSVQRTAVFMTTLYINAPALIQVQMAFKCALSVYCPRAFGRQRKVFEKKKINPLIVFEIFCPKEYHGPVAVSRTSEFFGVSRTKMHNFQRKPPNHFHIVFCSTLRS